MDLHFNGNVNIENLNDQKGASMAVALPGGVVHQNVQPEEKIHKKTSKTQKTSSASDASVHLRDKKPNKLEFFRVIKALCLDGFFEDEHGGKINEKDVFAAFGVALNEDFSDYTKHLSEGRSHNSIPESANIFDELKEKYLAYERKLKEDKIARNK